jgi:hypothetical protein
MKETRSHIRKTYQNIIALDKHVRANSDDGWIAAFDEPHDMA